jgi:hypothetical protein
MTLPPILIPNVSNTSLARVLGDASSRDAGKPEAVTATRAIDRSSSLIG